MTLFQDIEAATAEGRVISGLYAQLRTTRAAAERAAILRQVGERADSLGQRLRRLAEQRAGTGPDAEARAAMARLGEAMEQVMVQEREYRMASGAPPDPQDEAMDSSKS